MSNNLVHIVTRSVSARYTEDWDLLVGDKDYYTVEELAEIYPNVLEEDDIPFLMDTDSYKLSHPDSYPEAKSMTAYFTFRGPFEFKDQRINFVGARYAYEKIFSRRVTWFDIAQADAYTAQHSAGGTQFAWPRDLWIRVINELGGALPFTVKALRDGETIYPQIPGFTVTADEPYEDLVTWFETQLMRTWSPTTTATKSAHIENILREKFELSVDEEQHWLLPYAMQDFGSRGTSSAETSMTSGMGYLSVFDGTDNIISAFLCTRYNNGVPVGQSVIASEHSVMTAWDSEEEALQHLIDICPAGGIISVVADSYDYVNFLWQVVPKFVDQLRAKNIKLVVRPDSGNPLECVLEGLRALESAFGAVKNKKGYKVIQGAAVLQGDGIDIDMLARIADAVYHAGYSAECVIYGMGGGLHQKQNRDTLKTAMKLCKVVLADGRVKLVAKAPKSDSSKGSLAGGMQVNLVSGIPVVYPEIAHWEDKRLETDMLEIIWDRGPVDYKFETWAQVRERHQRTWKSRPLRAEVVSTQMQEVTSKAISDIRASIASRAAKAQG